MRRGIGESSGESTDRIDGEGENETMKGNLRGAAKTTHSLKKYGNGESMNAGLERLAKESYKRGSKQG